MIQSKIKQKKKMAAPLVFIIGFFVIICLGALLLMLPISSADGRFTNPLDALFTAVSASCVTGLVAVDTAVHYSLFGQVVVLCLIQIGGLGFMSLSVLLSSLIRRAITPKEKLLIAQSMGMRESGGTVHFMRRILRAVFLFEGTGALCLTLCFAGRYGFAGGLYRGVFVAVSAFCNAGFDPFGTVEQPYQSLTAFAGDPVVLIVVMVLIVVGGIGFLVWEDVLAALRRVRRLSPYAKFVLFITGLLIFSGAILFMLFEWHNPDTLGGFTTGQKVVHSFFQSVTLRTAGFGALDLTKCTEESSFISILYMLIGGASASTAGGLKVGTFGVLLAAAGCAALGRTKVIVFHRRISKETVMRALSITVIGASLVIVSGLAISVIEGSGILAAMYETASAYATVGLSIMGTPGASAITKCILMVLMFLGRVGLLTVTYAIAMRMNRRTGVDYPYANMLVG
ncbi:MAG: potassium uptake protein, TrkH family [Clostridiales bacterium]|nr:potassium uptake protein, TrkH family [Clostridiales bacterium]